MNKKEKAAEAVKRLKAGYPDTCSLVSENAWQLLFSTRLSAQCTDKRVNEVTKVLWKKYPTLEALAEADYEELCKIVKPCGLFRTKARDILDSAVILVGKYGGSVPDTMEELLTLPGIGRKTANLVLSDVYGKPAIVADTHCIRITNRLGLCDSKDPYKVELQLVKIVEPEEQASMCHRLVHFGRDVCTARSPKCDQCPLWDICENQGK